MTSKTHDSKFNNFRILFTIIYLIKSFEINEHHILKSIITELLAKFTLNEPYVNCHLYLQSIHIIAYKH